VSPLPVVVGFDPVECRLSQVFDARPRTGVDEFFLVGREERFRDRIIEAISGTPERAPYFIVHAIVGEFFCRVLAAAVRIKPNSA
jgi:hypothetical protein